MGEMRGSEREREAERERATAGGGGGGESEKVRRCELAGSAGEMTAVRTVEARAAGRHHKLCVRTCCGSSVFMRPLPRLKVRWGWGDQSGESKDFGE